MKIVQLIALSEHNQYMALCDDGSLWELCTNGEGDYVWEEAFEGALPTYGAVTFTRPDEK